MLFPFPSFVPVIAGPKITDLGHTSATTASVTLTITVPAGATIVVCVVDVMGTAIAAPSDATNGSYTQIATLGMNNNTAANGACAMYYFQNSASLTSITLTYTGSAGSGRSISAVYLTGVPTTGVLDTAVTNTGFGSSTAPTVTSAGTAGQSSEMLIAMVGYFQSGTFTQDTGNGWSTPPNADTGTNAQLGAGSQINTGTGTKTFAPTLGTARTWATIIAGFKHS